MTLESIFATVIIAGVTSMLLALAVDSSRGVWARRLQWVNVLFAAGLLAATTAGLLWPWVAQR